MELGTTCTYLIIMGDYSIHIDDLDNSDAKQFNGVCMAIGSEQVVDFWYSCTGSHTRPGTT